MFDEACLDMEENEIKIDLAIELEIYHFYFHVNLCEKKRNIISVTRKYLNLNLPNPKKFLDQLSLNQIWGGRSCRMEFLVKYC